ncbi:MAG: DUF418 domain-containing protein [Phycisphaerales bacterium]|nr:DUF418 domain-containing protein [Phycisphaerales bacterium]
MAAPLTPATDRIESIDVVRGVAVLGILVMNIPSFALSASAFFNPTLDGGYSGVDRLAWIVSHLLFDMKMMAIFSMLFGAGVVIYGERKGSSALSLHARRMAWLLVIGLLHAFVIWEGDILVMYAICGMLVYPLRKARIPLVVGLAIPILVVPILIYSGFGALFEAMRADAIANPEHGASWNSIASEFTPGPEARALERDAFLGTYHDTFERRFDQVVKMLGFMFPTWGLWRIGGLMMLGIALVRGGFLDGSRPRRSALLCLGYPIGFWLVVVGFRRMEASAFDIVSFFMLDWHFNYVGSIFVALGHIGLLVTLSRSARWMTTVLAPVGRLALTNYLTQSLICATIFSGWGFGWWGRLSRSDLLLVVVAIWVVQICFSILWTRRFRFGPMEWVWRSLTTWSIQPMTSGRAGST